MKIKLDSNEIFLKGENMLGKSQPRPITKRIEFLTENVLKKNR
jgi:hypothetical protein